MTTKTNLTFEESIDKAIEILEQLRTQENNNGAFILTAAQDDPENPRPHSYHASAQGLPRIN